MEFSVESIILSVERRPELWDTSSESYKDRYKKREGWTQVCCEVFSGFEEKAKDDQLTCGIRTAGVRFPSPAEGVAACMTFPITIADVAEAISHSLPKTISDSRKEGSPSDVIYRHYNTSVKDILEADMKTGFEAFRAELRETSYKSYWRDEVGKIPDQVPNLPVGMDPENTTFGSKTRERTTAAELLNPKKCRALIDYESSVGRDLYCKSHNSYSAGEQKRAMDPPLPQNMIFGARNNVDNTGRCVKTLLQWIDQSVVSMTSRSMAEYKDLLYYPLGKGRVRTGVPAGITKDTTFGKPSHHGQQAVLKDRDKMLPLQVAYVFKIKQEIKKGNQDLKLLLTLFNEADPQRTKRLPANLVYRITADCGFGLSRVMLDPVLVRLKYLDEKDNTISYRHLLELIDAKIPLPDFGKEDRQNETNYSTNYMEQCADLGRKREYEKMPIAGTPAFKSDASSISLPFGPGWCLANLEDIPMQTTVDDVLRPHIFTHYGLSIYDVLKPRTKEFIKELFIKKVGLEIPENVFEMMWEEGMRRDGVVSVETFKNILSEISTGKLEQMADTSIHKEE